MRAIALISTTCLLLLCVGTAMADPVTVPAEAPGTSDLDPVPGTGENGIPCVRDDLSKVPPVWLEPTCGP